MSENNDKTRKAARQPVAASDAPSQDLLWQKFDTLLKEFLKMEQTSPAVEQRRPVRTT